MIPAYRDKTSARLAGTNFTLRLHEKYKFYPGKAGQISTRYLFTFSSAKTFSIYVEFLNNMADTTRRFITVMTHQLNCFSALLMNLFSLHNFILREHIFRQNLSIVSSAVTRKNKEEKVNEEDAVIKKKTKISMGGRRKR